MPHGILTARIISSLLDVFLPFLLFWLLIQNVPAVCQVSAEGDSSSIVVQVLCQGKPVKDAEVWRSAPLYRREKEVEIITVHMEQTGADGTISIPVCMRHGRIYNGSQLFARIPGRLSGFIGLYAFSNPDSVVINLFPTKTVSGVVRDGRGRPIPGAKVAAWRIDGDGVNEYGGIELHKSIPGMMALTDSLGRFSLEGIPEPSRVCLKATAPGFAGLDIQKIPAGTDGLTLTLGPESRITGRVTFATGKPAPGILVLGQAKLSTRSSQTSDYDTTDENGRYTLKHLTSGMYIVKVDPDSTLRDWVSMPLANVGAGRGKTVENADITLVRGITVTGKVVEKETGNPMPGEPMSATQIISDEQQTNWWNQRLPLSGAWTDKNGEFRFQVLPGEVEVNTYPIHGNPSLGWSRGGFPVRVTIEEGKAVSPVTVRFERGVDIRGIVRNPDGAPATDVEFICGPHTYAYSDGRGNFVLPGIIPGRSISFRAVSPKGVFVEDFSVRADSSDTVTVILHAPRFYTVEGIIVDEQGNPAPGIPVDLDTAEGLICTARSGAAVTGGDGRFSMDHISGGRLFRFSVGNRLGTSEPFQAENVKPPLRIVLPRADRWLDGTVCDAEGKPVSGMKVHIWSDKGHADTIADRNGHFRVEGLAARQVGLTFNGLQGYFEFQGVATNERRDFVLPTGRHYLSGQVTDARGKPLASASVEIIRNEKWGWPTIIQTDSQGCFYFSELGQRTVTLKVISPGYREQTLRVRTDREDVRFRLEKAGEK